ncbi:MAG: hypothetical protein E4H10_14170, partial [Bacteroidia bacterium]
MIFFLLITCESGFNRGIAQDNKLYLTPWIQEIILPSPNHEIPNETFYRNHLGTLFIGKNNGLTIISGQEMNHLLMEGPVFVGGDESDTLFYAAQNDLGFLVRQQNHVYKKVSRVHFLSASLRTFSPTGFVSEGRHMVLSSNKGTYLLSRTKTEFLKDGKTQKLQAGIDTILNQELLRQLSDKTGITRKGIRQISRYSDDEIWILGAYSLHRIIDPSPLSIMETGPLIPGRILNSQVSRGQILLGTTQGIYSLDQQSDQTKQWKVTDLLIEDHSPVRMLHSAYNQTIGAGPRGLYLVRGMQSETLDKGSFTGILIL